MLLVLLLIAGAVIAAMYFAQQRGLFPADLLDGTPFQGVFTATLPAADQIAQQTDSFMTTLQPTVTRVQEISTQSGTVLGSIVQVNEADENKKPHEKALDYAQYLYCKQVVDQWDEQQAEKTAAKESTTQE